MDLWQSYERLPPLERIFITFSVTAILVFVLYIINKQVKQRRSSKVEFAGRSGHLDRKADGTLLAYIAFWRYLFFGAIYAFAFYICMYGFVVLYQDLPSGFYKHWNKNASLTFFVLVLGAAMFIWGYSLLKSGYKKVQFELDNYNLRYLASGVRGGIILSESIVSVALSDIREVELRQNMFGGGVITARTSMQTHTIMLLLPEEELQICFTALKQAIHNRQQQEKRT